MESSSQNTACFSHPNRTLVIMAKAPKPGMVKTRLRESLPSPAVTALYRCLLEDTLALATSLTNVEVAVMCPESDQDELVQLLGSTVRVVAQKGEGLAAGLTSVFRQFAATGQQHVIAFNSDSPHLAPAVLDSAFEILTTHDVVIGPRSALDRLLTRAKVLELSTGFTEPFYDIDVANDLILLARELRLAPAKAPKTAGWFGEWQQAVAQLRH